VVTVAGVAAQAVLRVVRRTIRVRCREVSAAGTLPLEL